jgi:hypothetical protein
MDEVQTAVGRPRETAPKTRGQRPPATYAWSHSRNSKHMRTPTITVRPTRRTVPVYLYTRHGLDVLAKLINDRRRTPRSSERRDGYRPRLRVKFYYPKGASLSRSESRRHARRRRSAMARGTGTRSHGARHRS